MKKVIIGMKMEWPWDDTVNLLINTAAFIINERAYVYTNAT